MGVIFLPVMLKYNYDKKLACGSICAAGTLEQIIPPSIILIILVPIANRLGIDPIWYAILVAMNLQTSFLTPPFGFSLFYLKGIAPPEVRTTDIYSGVIPFITLQAIVLTILVIWPNLFGF